ncbi:MAG: AzlD domain-containing protein [Oscillospiraceae bacterium]|nr:AzlD domain-containing protein [Oscillospiraceae bacterium]
MTAYILFAILVSAMITFGLRALPFAVFSGNRSMPGWLKQLGTILPSSIMAVLVVYCLKAVKSDVIGTGIPSAIAVAVVVLSYKWKHSTFLSIILGTVAYMILIRLM